jgi:hypothetical protein
MACIILLFDKRIKPKTSEIAIAKTVAQTISPIVTQMPASIFGEKVTKNSKYETGLSSAQFKI